jgi:hypothetical protein
MTNVTEIPGYEDFSKVVSNETVAEDMTKNSDRDNNGAEVEEKATNKYANIDKLKDLRQIIIKLKMTTLSNIASEVSKNEAIANLDAVNERYEEIQNENFRAKVEEINSMNLDELHGEKKYGSSALVGKDNFRKLKDLIITRIKGLIKVEKEAEEE